MIRRGGNIPPATRREWIEAHEKGKSIKDIARESRRTERTILEHLKRARQEREQLEIRRGLLREAYGEHFRELLGVAEAINRQAESPRPNGLLHPQDRRTGLLLKGLREHLIRSPLWRTCSEWERAASGIEQEIERARREVERLARAAFQEYGLSSLPAEGFVASLLQDVKSAARGAPGDDLPWEYSLSHGSRDLYLGEYHLAHTVPDGNEQEAREPVSSPFLERVEELHRRLRSEVVALPHVGRLSAQLRAWEKARSEIAEEVETLTLRHILPGTCYLCPQ